MDRSLKHTIPFALTVWCCFVLGSYIWNSADNQREQKAVALETARAFFRQIMVTRTWNAQHGGVFVYSSEKAPINPYLPADDRELITRDGIRLTRMNPAYMTRQIAEIAQRQGAITFHITSLTPLNPKNDPLDWERQWLQEFNTGALEKNRLENLKKGRKFYYMAPLVVKKICLDCHKSQGYKVGDIKGGISISMTLLRSKRYPLSLLLSHLIAASIGIIFILLFAVRINRTHQKLHKTNILLTHEIEERRTTENELRHTKELLETRIQERTTELVETNNLLDKRIQERQRIEKALGAINDEFIQLFNSAPDGMLVTDNQFTIIRANNAFSDLVHLKHHEIISQKCFEILGGKNCHTPDCPVTQILNGRGKVEVESIKIRPDNTTFPCMITATPFQDSNGTITGTTMVCRDISEWKNTASSLSSAADDLREKNRDLQDFAHVISHDLQEPLMLIRAFSDRLKKNYTHTLENKGNEYLYRIQSSTKRMQDLIDGLLLYSRVTSKGQPFEQVDLNSTIQVVLEDLAIRIEETKATVTVDHLGSIEADPLQLRQLLQNIIGNALKYRFPDRSPEIAISLIPFSDEYSHQNYIRFAIKDNGIGFNPQYQSQVFEIFQRLHSRRDYSGTGIGLAISKKIVERHNGNLTADAVPEKGATFTITLPFNHPEKSQHKSTGDNDLIRTVMHRR